ncbi:MAG TPA: META domain-containing protein [Candidatus Binatia bacterium]|nr:META domain-containing protein [Candidatus Binatia bacterium]
MAAVLLFVVAACGGGPGPSPSSPSPSAPPPGNGNGSAPAGLDGRTFLSTQVLVDGREHVLVPGTRIRLEFRDGRIGASAGCNQLGGQYRLDGDVLVVTNAAVTEMGCDPARHAQDEWLFGLLGQRPVVSFDGDELTLTADTTVIAMVDRRILEPDLPLVGTEWVLTSILSGEVASSVPAGVVAWLRFGDDGQVAVETGCNSGGGRYRVDGDRIVFGDLILTKRACVGPEGQVEAAVLAVLGAGEVRFGIDGSTLRLVAGSAGLDFRSPGGLD